MIEFSLSAREGMRRLAISYQDLRQDYIGLGGRGSVGDVRRSVEFDETPTDYEHSVIAQALNDRFTDRGEDHPLGYRNLYSPDET